MDKDIKNLIRDEIINNLGICIEENFDYSGTQSICVELLYGDEVISRSEEICIVD